MFANVQNIIESLETLDKKNLVPSAGDTIHSLRVLQVTLDALQNAPAPLRAGEIGGHKYAPQSISHALRRLIKAGMVNRVKIGEEVLHLHKSGRHNFSKNGRYLGYTEGEPFDKTVDIYGFELNR